MGFALLLMSSTEGWSLPPCPGSPVSNWEATRNWTYYFGSFTVPNGDKSVGEFKDGKMHGQGTAIGPEGNKYVGEFKDNKYHGKGTKTSADGKVKEGIMVEMQIIQ